MKLPVGYRKFHGNKFLNYQLNRWYSLGYARFERHRIPYNNSFLTAIKIPAKTDEVKGTIIGIPGFDAFIEEFYAIWNHFAEKGYDFIAFEGPGQGGSRRLYNQTFDHDYEKPTKAVLDYFDAEDVTALGVSMGGYWIIRAAAFEKRIARVIAMPPLYDWLEMDAGDEQGAYLQPPYQSGCTAGDRRERCISTAGTA